MKRLLFILAITMAAIGSLQAAQINETDARQVADKFFSAKSSRFTARPGQSAVRLAYTADEGRFYVYDRGQNNGFVVVAGDDRLPQVLGYSDHGDFSAPALPPAMQYWLNEMSRQIAFLQSHDNVTAYRPAKRATAVEPLLTTFWDQGAPFNDMCPTYGDGSEDVKRAVTGCVATAFAQVMNYYEWPVTGTGSHSYTCNVNGSTPTQLSVDFSQSVYQWDLMLDRYDANSSPESCEAVAKLMFDVGVSMDMGYGSSSGASEVGANRSMMRYFGYNKKSYILDRDYYGAEEWDQILVDEISEGRPVIYCGYFISSTESGGHAFVLDGFNTDGYFHVNWGWGGSSDGYFLVSVLAPSSSMNFEYMQDGIFGFVPEPRANEVKGALYVHSQLVPRTNTAAMGDNVTFALDNFAAQGNMLDTAGYEMVNNRRNYYALLPLSLAVYDQAGVERYAQHFNYKEFLGDYWGPAQNVEFVLPEALEDGEYKIKMAYSTDNGVNYDHPVRDFSGKDLYVKMQVNDNVAYLSDCFLANTYTLDSFVLPNTITTNKPFDVTVNLSYFQPWGGGQDGPVGNVYMSLLKDGVEVSTSEMREVHIFSNMVEPYELSLMAPAEWGGYDLVLNDESGNHIMTRGDWYQSGEVAKAHVFVLPPCEVLSEDFESMPVSSATSDKNVQGSFTTWNFTKGGVRAPGEGRCNGSNSVMMKKGGTMSNAEPLSHNFFMAQATFFNQSSTAAKYTLEYSFDGGSTWQKANTIDEANAAEVPEKTQLTAMWALKISASKPVTFRIAMTAGGTGSTYVDDVIFYYNDNVGDVNYDGEISIADVNVIADVILTGGTLSAADVNGDGEVNIADINTLIDMLLSE